jgi:hypothetical protein
VARSSGSRPGRPWPDRARTVEQCVHLVGRAEHRVAHRAQFVHVGIGVRERHVGLGADHGQRTAKLVRGVRDEAFAGLEGSASRRQLPPGQRPAQGGRDERRTGQRQQVLHAELPEREIGILDRQRAVQMPRHQPVRHGQQHRHEDDEDAAVEGGEANAKRRAHTR